jgi:hexosaminidase
MPTFKIIMKRSLVIIVLIILCLQVAIAQVGQNKPLNGLRLTWKMVTNSYENKSQSRSALVFNAVSDWKFPAKGWKIYFNFSRQIIPNSMTSGLQVQHINGDFFSISPTADFKGIDSGSSLSVEFTSTEWLLFGLG